MYGKLLKAGFMLAMLLIVMVSLSMAACPRAVVDGLYYGKCGEVLSIPAPGVLANDAKDKGKTLQVVNPDSITIINPSHGTIKVKGDGSFVYTAADNVASGTYTGFYYTATDGSCVSNRVYAKIAVGCTCHGRAPDLIFYGVTTVTAADLIARGVACLGCPENTPVFGLSNIGTQTGIAYPYTVSCVGCTPSTGHVTFLNCSDNDVCNGIETYDPVQGICVPGTPLSCNDNNACNGVETCDPVNGCVAGTPLTCNDNNACNGVETCDAATGCVAGAPLTCDDNNVCNGVETCDPVNGCVAGAPLTCDDNNACNGAETCDPVNGCVAGTPLTCNDNNVCNGVETCDPVYGCVEGTPLICPDDNNVCNGVETCDPVDGCKPGTPLTCNDDNACNGVETCDPVDGCVAGTPLTCNDNNVCNGVETCDPVDGCVEGTPLTCPDDNNVCTNDFCDPVTGCQRINEPDGTICDLTAECAGDVWCDGGFCLGHENRCRDIYDPAHCDTNDGYCTGYHCCTNPGRDWCVKSCGEDPLTGCPTIVGGPQTGTCIT